MAIRSKPAGSCATASGRAEAGPRSRKRSPFDLRFRPAAKLATIRVVSRTIGRVPADANRIIKGDQMIGRRGVSRLAVLAVAGLMAAPPARADAVSDFYAGKSLQLVIGYPPGGGYDLYARALGRYIGRHIPGNPSIVVQNMPGAGSIKAANFLYKIAPKDGTTFGGFARGTAIDPLFGRGDSSSYDPQKFSWLGSISNEVGVCAFRSGVGIKSWQDMQTTPFVIGATGAGADSDVFPTVLRKMFNLKMKLIAGYHSAADVVLAIRRNEVDGRCGWSWSSLVSWNKEMLQEKQINVVLQLAAKKLDELPDVPLVTDLTNDPDQKTALRLILSRQTMARPYVAPPGVPADRLRALRAAFDATMRDPDFLADAKKQDLEVRPVSGIEAEALIKETYATPPEVVKLAVDYMKETP
jgi:tripartite-type tricarboxylate transporter receptor subunit TctC